MRRALIVAVLLVVMVAISRFGESAPVEAAKLKAGPIELLVNLSAGATSAFTLLDADGQLSADPFELPGKFALLVTDLLVTPNAVEGVYQGNIDNLGGTENRLRFRVDSNAQAMLHLPLSSGLRFTTTPRAFAFGSNPGACVIRLIGTLKKK